MSRGGLDINTPKGQEYLKYERVVISKIKEAFSVDVIETKKDEDSRIDNLIAKDGTLVAIAEVKCRNMTFKQMEDWGNTWLVTTQKLEDGLKASEIFSVPFLGFLYLIPEDVLLYWKISDRGKYCFDFETKETVTQRTCNGGTASRINSYLPVSKSKRI